MSSTESHDIVIVGGGICGLATALALHRKGLSSLVLERSDELRAAGLAIGWHSNGWRALDHLGVGAELRKKAIRLSGIRDVTLASGARKEALCGKEELRCLKRRDLVEVLAGSLPPESIRFGCHIVAMGEDPVTSFPTIHIRDGRTIHAKILIGCDGVNSIVAKSLGLQDPKYFSTYAVRGFTYFPDSHDCDNVLLRLRGERAMLGIIPIDDKLVHWVAACIPSSSSPLDSELQKDPNALKHSTEEMLNGFPEEATTMVKNCDPASLLASHIRYRAPWALLNAHLWKGTATVAGDAMHVMGPFLGQGGCSSVEDAVVLARCLAREMQADKAIAIEDSELRKKVGRAFDIYVKERRWRILRLSLQTYLMGTMLQSSSKLLKLVILLVLVVFFGRNPLSHVQYDCGGL